MSTTNNPLPTIILVHGAWHTPANYAPYTRALEASGFKVHCPHLPSCSGTLPPVASLPEDVSHVRSLVRSVVEDAEEHVLMIMHSYGGAVVGSSGAALRGLTAPERRAEGKRGGVVHLLYLCAYMLQPGQAIWDVVVEAGVAPLWGQFITDYPDGSTFPVDPAMAFFSVSAAELGKVAGEEVEADLKNKKELEEMKGLVDEAMRHLVRFPLSAMKTPQAGDDAAAAWKVVPATYVQTQRDWSVPRAYQDIMIKRVQEVEGVRLKLLDFDADHSLFITRTDEMVEVALQAAIDERNNTNGE
ncbi:alpha/beta-hydrolase [Xylariomycetidae sp. FL2044]|nr:alpha/beta-hydrolase [Xylariomycetidae sp. FL2044]